MLPSRIPTDLQKRQQTTRTSYTHCFDCESYKYGNEATTIKKNFATTASTSTVCHRNERTESTNERISGRHWIDYNIQQAKKKIEPSNDKKIVITKTKQATSETRVWRIKVQQPRIYQRIST